MVHIITRLNIKMGRKGRKTKWEFDCGKSEKR